MWNEYDEKTGDIRVKSGFLFWPKRIGNEVRWLERATWTEEYDGEDFETCGWYPLFWGAEAPRYQVADAGRAHLKGREHGD